MKFCACTRPPLLLAKISANIYDFTTERHDIQQKRRKVPFMTFNAI